MTPTLHSASTVLPSTNTSWTLDPYTWPLTHPSPPLPQVTPPLSHFQQVHTPSLALVTAQLSTKSLKHYQATFTL